MNGLRMSAEVVPQTPERQVRIAIENTTDREYFLHLGTAGVGGAEAVKGTVTSSGGIRRSMFYGGGNGLAPGRIVPMIVPLLAHSVYRFDTPLRYWLYRPQALQAADVQRVDELLSKDAKLEFHITVPEGIDAQFISCYGLRMFWTGTMRSGPVVR